MPQKIIVIVGPTAIGKTSLAIKLAKKIKAEIISADSMQAYKGMDILSQKPTPPELKTVPHHLVSFLDPEYEYNAAIFTRKSKKIIKDIIKKGKIPIIVGGSGLYVKALVNGIFPSKGKNKLLRKKLEKIASVKGSLFLYNRLKKVDPTAARAIHPNDARRIIRALEIYEVDKKTKTSLKRKTKGIKEKYEVKVFGLKTTREKLYGRINKRVDLMFKKGLVKEIKKLLGLHLSITAGQALGIKEIRCYLDKTYDIDNAKEILKRNTRRLAKRQFTWFRADKEIRWLDFDRKNEKKVIDVILKAIN